MRFGPVFVASNNNGGACTACSASISAVCLHIPLTDAVETDGAAAARDPLSSPKFVLQKKVRAASILPRELLGALSDTFKGTGRGFSLTFAFEKGKHILQSVTGLDVLSWRCFPRIFLFYFVLHVTIASDEMTPRP